MEDGWRWGLESRRGARAGGQPLAEISFWSETVGMDEQAQGNHMRGGGWGTKNGPLRSSNNLEEVEGGTASLDPEAEA